MACMFTRDENVNLCGVDTKIVTHSGRRSQLLLSATASQIKATAIYVLSELRFSCSHRKDLRSHREQSLRYIEFGQLKTWTPFSVSAPDNHMTY